MLKMSTFLIRKLPSSRLRSHWWLNGGLFASNRNLGRGVSKNFETGFSLKRLTWTLEGTVFKRSDDNLVDWTFHSSSPNIRSANHVDIDTSGLEFLVTRIWDDFQAMASYAYLHKEEDYKDATVDASFYALNFPKHELTLGVIWDPSRSGSNTG